MGGNSTTTSNTSTTPTFSGQGQQLLNSLMQQGQSNAPGNTASGQFLESMLTTENPYMQEQVAAIRQNSAAELPKQLASARSMTRGRPDTFGAQTAANVTADNMASRDMGILELMSNQFNQDRAAGGQAAQTMLGAQGQHFGNQSNLLSLLRGEDSQTKETTKTKNPMKDALAIAGLVAAPFTGGASLAATGAAMA